MTTLSKTPRYIKRYKSLYDAGYRLSVDAAPYQRKLRALRCVGHGLNRLTAGVGLDKSFLADVSAGRKKRMRKQSADAIDAYWAANWDVRHVDGPGQRATNYARRQGWLAPLDYDDIEEGI